MSRTNFISNVLGIAGVVALAVGAVLQSANWGTLGTGMFVTNFPLAFMLIVFAVSSIIGILITRRYALIIVGIVSLCFLGYTYQENATAKRNFEKAEISLWQAAISSFPTKYGGSSDVSDRNAGTATMFGERKAILLAQDYLAAWILLFVGSILILTSGLIGTPRFREWFKHTFGFLFNRRV